jgi:hypothetical protein
MKMCMRSTSAPRFAFLACAASAALVACSSTSHEGSGDQASFEVQADSKSTTIGVQEMQLPPGWTEADMQACMAAGTPGEMQKKLARGVGRWAGTNSMWMAPGTEPMKTQCTANISSLMEGRYVKCEFAGDMPGMGPFQGMGFEGFDNVTQKFVAAWMDNHSTGIMNGDGTLSADGSTLTWNYSYMCPITKKPTTMREVDHYTGDNSMTMDMWSIDPKSGKEYKCMHIELTRQSL